MRTFDKDSCTKISELINISSSGISQTLYLLYDINLKTVDNVDDESSSESSDSELESSEEKRNDEEDKLYMEMFTDILSLLILKSKERLAPPRVKRESTP